jgi:hypothetical protein
MNEADGRAADRGDASVWTVVLLCSSILVAFGCTSGR